MNSSQWTYLTDLGGMSGSATEGNPLALRHFDSVEALSESAPYAPYVAHDLPEGYSLREAVLLPDDTALLFYGGPGPDILLSSNPVGTRTIARASDPASGKQVVSEESRIVAHAVQDDEGSSELAQEVQVRGQRGIWRARVGDVTADAWAAALVRQTPPNPWAVNPQDYIYTWLDRALADVLAGANPSAALAQAQAQAAAYADCRANGEEWRTCAKRAEPSIALPAE